MLYTSEDPNNPALFEERLVRYARTILCPAHSVLVFEYVSIHKRAERFDFVPVAEYVVDVRSGEVAEHLFGRVAVAKQWYDDSDLRAQVRRVIRRGKVLMRGGYRRLQE